MDVLNKLRSTVSSTVSSLSNVLPGNPVTREFEVSAQICSAGPGLVWKIYSGYKKSTKQEAAIFVFEKKYLEKWPRDSRENILESLRRGVAQLTRLRHPQVLIVHHPLEESRESLAFATEPVLASIANVLGNYENSSASGGQSFKNLKLFDVEIKYGLLQLSEGLAFLHNDVKLLHNNICPESIVINQQGAWKIFGFDFSIQNDSGPDTQPTWKCVEHSAFQPQVVQPNLDYLSPESGLANIRTPSTDMFALGVLIYALYNNGAPVLAYHNDYNSFKTRVNELKNVSANKFSKIPDGLLDTEKMLLNYTAQLRPDAHQFKNITFFEDVGVKTLNYLDSLFQWDKLQKSQFYKGLSPIIKNFPQRVCLHRVVPCLAKEFADPSMVPFILPVVLQIAESCSREEFMVHIFPHLRTAMTMTEPVQILLFFMQKMELLLKLTPAEEVKTDVLPMLYRALDSDAQQIQELCLSVLPTYSSLVDYPAMKNALLPRIKRLATKTAFLSVRVSCLVCIGKLLEDLDKWLVLDEILPFLPSIPSREPAVLMAILGIYKVTLTHKKLGIPKEVIATKVIPFLMPLTIENGLTLSQFNTLFAVLRDMINRVESEHRTKLEQLNEITKQTNSLKADMTAVSKEDNQPKFDLDSLFSSLEAGSNGNNEKSGLSMHAKQAIVKQQEVESKFNVKSVPLTPSPTPPTAKPRQLPEDLTSTLVNSNINQISSSWGSQAPQASQQSNFNQMSSNWPSQVGGQPSQRSFPMPNLNQTNYFNQQPQTMWRPPNYNPTIPAGSTPMLTPMTFPMGSTLPILPPATNMASPMSLLGTSTNYANKSSTSASSAKPLSTSEINDLLS